MSKELSQYEYPESLPEGYYWSEVQEWTCPDHDHDVNYGDCSEPCCATCMQCYTAGWRRTGVFKPAGDMGVLAQILKDAYLPTIMEQLNRESIFVKLEMQEDMQRERYGELPEHPSQGYAGKSGV